MGDIGYGQAKCHLGVCCSYSFKCSLYVWTTRFTSIFQVTLVLNSESWLWPFWFQTLHWPESWVLSELINHTMLLTRLIFYRDLKACVRTSCHSYFPQITNYLPEAVPGAVYLIFHNNSILLQSAHLICFKAKNQTLKNWPGDREYCW